MTAFLSAEWLEASRPFLDRVVDSTSLDISVEVKVTGGPAGDVTFHSVIDDGLVEELGLGPGVDADVSLTVTYSDAAAILKGDLDVNVAYMQGRMKTAGDPGKLLEVLASTSSRQFSELREALVVATEL